MKEYSLKLNSNQNLLQFRQKDLRISNVKKIILTAESSWAQQFWRSILAALQNNS